MSAKSMRIPVILKTKQIAGALPALIDCGAQGKFIHRRAVKQLGLIEQKLSKPIKVYNVDGTPNALGYIRNFVTVDLDIEGRKQREELLVTQLGKQDLILGINWLQKHNPRIDWVKGTLTFPDYRSTIEELPDNEGIAVNTLPEGYKYILEEIVKKKAKKLLKKEKKSQNANSSTINLNSQRNPITRIIG